MYGSVDKASNNTMADYKKVPEGDSEASEAEDAQEVETKPKQKLVFGYPVQVVFILGNEFCERFSYYGMHAILVIYLTSQLKMSKDSATAVYHAFNMLCYFSPIFGAILADSFLGKYKTILYVSLIYALGNIVVSVTAVPSILAVVELAGVSLGLLLIAVGTGGIKPCVSAFGGDQFEAGQEEKLQKFFSIFYFSINFGSLIATLLTPVLRGDVTCFGNDCYPLAFGVPAILMIVSLLLFLAGSRLYKKVPPEGNIVVEVTAAVGSALKNRIKGCGTGVKKDHWLDWASDKYSPVLISDVKALFKVLFMFLPLPVFWTLFDQQGSRWTLQAMEMNGDIALNPVFVMILIPVTETFIYPVAKYFKVLNKPLQRMGTGMALTAISFVIAGFLQIKMEAKSPVANLPPTSAANYRIINAVPCGIDLYSENLHKYRNMSVDYKHVTDYFQVPTSFKRLTVSTKCPPQMTYSTDITIKEKESYSLIVGTNHSTLKVQQLVDDVTPYSHGHSKVRFVHAGGSVADRVRVKLNKTLSFRLTPFEKPKYFVVEAKLFSVRVLSNDSSNTLAQKKLLFGSGGIYTVVIQPNQKVDGLKIYLYADVSPRPISILWQIPQYIIITLGEVMFSITGLEFAYSQAPPSMKSCIMAAWLLTVSVGNLLVVILAGVELTEDMAEEFFFFAILLAVVTVIFIIMAYFYKYVNYGSSRDEGQDGGNENNDEKRPLLADEEIEDKKTDKKLYPDLNNDLNNQPSTSKDVRESHL